jgi:hypothetical protein
VWTTAAVLIAVPALFGLLLTYSLILEYGGADTRTFVSTAVVMAVFAASSAGCAVRAVRSRGVDARMVLWVPVVAVIAALATAAAAITAQRQFTTEEQAAATACTAGRVAQLTALGLPGRAEQPAGQRDGACMGMPVVPQPIAQAEATLRAALAAHGWTPDSTGDGHPVYRKSPYRLVMYESYEMADGTMLRLAIR